MCTYCNTISVVTLVPFESPACMWIVTHLWQDPLINDRNPGAGNYHNFEKEGSDAWYHTSGDDLLMSSRLLVYTPCAILREA